MSALPGEEIDWNRNTQAYSDIEESRHKYVFPFLWEKLIALDAKNILDYGCGDGSFFKAKPEKLELSTAIGFDPSKTLLSTAKSKNFEPTNQKFEFFSEIKPSFHSAFDVVTLTAVWMTLNTESKCLKVLQDIKGTLSKNGVLLATITHPCFRQEPFESFRTDFSNKDYFTPGTQFNVSIYDDDKSVVLQDYHWNLENIFHQIQTAGLQVGNLWELRDPGSIGSSWMVIAISRRDEFASVIPFG